jgi:hypothetical protein
VLMQAPKHTVKTCFLIYWQCLLSVPALRSDIPAEPGYTRRRPVFTDFILKQAISRVRRSRAQAHQYGPDQRPVAC